MLPAVDAAAAPLRLAEEPCSSGTICDTADRLCTRMQRLCLSAPGADLRRLQPIRPRHIPLCVDGASWPPKRGRRNTKHAAS
jgi:hypothetical protein